MSGFDLPDNFPSTSQIRAAAIDAFKDTTTFKNAEALYKKGEAVVEEKFEYVKDAGGNWIKKKVQTVKSVNSNSSGSSSGRELMCSDFSLSALDTNKIAAKLNINDCCVTLTGTADMDLKSILKGDFSSIKFNNAELCMTSYTGSGGYASAYCNYNKNGVFSMLGKFNQYLGNYKYLSGSVNVNSLGNWQGNLQLNMSNNLSLSINGNNNYGVFTLHYKF